MIRRLSRPPRPRLKTLRELGDKITLLDGRGRPLRAGTPGPPPAYDDTVNSLYEDIGESGSVEASKAGFSPEGGKSSRTWQICPSSYADLISAVTLILGTTGYAATGTGKLNRTLPQADPGYAWLYASSIPTIEGYGGYTKQAADSTLEAPGFPYGTLWEYYRLHVESMQRPFPVLSDASINAYTGESYPETGGGDTAVYYPVAEEQNRYAVAKFVPQNDYVTQQKGTWTSDSDDAGNNKSFPGNVKFLLPNMLYVVQFFQVPLRWVVSPRSYFRRWLSRINQNAMTGPDGYEFNPGELLYLSFDPGTPFTPPVQNLVPLGGPSGGTIVSTEKFCNLTLTFLYTTRTNISPPPIAPGNNNYLTVGHNCLPWLDGNFRYFKTQTPDTGFPTNFRPNWLSAPLETLFTDPDSVGFIPLS